MGVCSPDLKPGNVLIASERGADLPLVKLADFGVSLLTGEGSGPVGLLAGKPSGASLRGAVRPPRAPPLSPSSESLSPTRGLPTQDLYSVGDDDDDDADTGSIMGLDQEEELGTASILRSELQPGGRPPPPASSVMSISDAARASAGPPGARRPPAGPLDPQTLELPAPGEDPTAAIAASLDAGDARTMQRPSQGSMSKMLAAAHDESVVVSGLLTQTDALIGTPMYMAPELWNSGSHRAEPLSDIFSVGVIAFELLTGRMPYAVPPVMSRANDEPIYITRLSQIRPDLEPRLLALIESCLALNPDSRLRASELSKRLIELGAQSPQG